MLTKERIARIKECKKLVVKLPLETAIQLEKTENDLVIANQENKRLREAMFEIYDMRYGHASDAKFKEIMNVAEKALGGEADE